MKRIIAVFAAAIFVIGCISACTASQPGSTVTDQEDTAANADTASKDTETTNDTEKKSLKIVTTIFPEYDWVMAILGEQEKNAEVTMLLDNGVDLHSYQPTVDDIMKISTCDLFIYVGGESDEWVEDALDQAVNKDMVVINLLEVLGDQVKTEEVVEGMEAEHDHDHEHEDGEEEDHEDGEEEHDHEDGEEEELDEHVWVSLRNAETLCDAIANALKKIDPANKDEYQANVDAYKDQLAALDAEYTAAVEGATIDTLLFGDRFPFRYLVDDYGLSYYAAFVGCSAETEASFETVIFLANKTDELGLSSIITIENNDHKVAETIRDNTSGKDQQILTMNSMQSTTSQDAANGTTYLSVMTDNLRVLKQALQ